LVNDVPRRRGPLGDFLLAHVTFLFFGHRESVLRFP
jgi:hypothetical protein